MARTTPNRGWSYPDFEENPYDTTIVGFFEDQDADVHLLATGVRTVPVGGTGASTFTTNALLYGNGVSPIQAGPSILPGLTGASVVQTLWTQAGYSATGANTTETTLGTYTLPANTLTVTGRTVHVRLAILAGVGGTVRLYFGGTVVASGAVANANVFIDCDISRYGSNGQFCMTSMVFGTSGSGGVLGITYTPTTITETASAVIHVTGQNSSATSDAIALLLGMITLHG